MTCVREKLWKPLEKALEACCLEGSEECYIEIGERNSFKVDTGGG
jgi:hypothetical protein